jgi:hypothetical protein
MLLPAAIRQSESENRAENRDLAGEHGSRFVSRETLEGAAAAFYLKRKDFRAPPCEPQCLSMSRLKAQPKVEPDLK